MLAVAAFNKDESHTVTTAREFFTHSESSDMAFLIFKRFGRVISDAAEAWRRLLGNNCSDCEFAKLVHSSAFFDHSAFDPCSAKILNSVNNYLLPLTQASGNINRKMPDTMLVAFTYEAKFSHSTELGDAEFESDQWYDILEETKYNYLDYERDAITDAVGFAKDKLSYMQDEHGPDVSLEVRVVKKISIPYETQLFTPLDFQE